MDRYTYLQSLMRGLALLFLLCSLLRCTNFFVMRPGEAASIRLG